MQAASAASFAARANPACSASESRAVTAANALTARERETNRTQAVKTRVRVRGEMARARLSSFRVHRAQRSSGDSVMDRYAEKRPVRTIRAIAQATNPYAAPFRMQIDPTAHQGLATRFRTGREAMTPGAERKSSTDERCGRPPNTKSVFDAASAAPTANHFQKIRPLIPVNVRQASAIDDGCRHTRAASFANCS